MQSREILKGRPGAWALCGALVLSSGVACSGDDLGTASATETGSPTTASTAATAPTSTSASSASVTEGESTSESAGTTSAGTTSAGTTSAGTTSSGTTSAGNTAPETESATGTTEGTSTGSMMKPDDAPDWLIVAVSGHCIPPGCEVPGTNHEYLTKVGTTDRIVAALTDAGYSAEVWAYSDEFYNRDAQTSQLLPGEGDPLYFGFLQLHQDLGTLRDAWIAGFDDPTRVIVVAHSHGVVWAHTALHVVDDLPVELMIDLDGVSMGWEEDSLLAGFGDDWDNKIAQYNDKYDASWPFNLGDAEAGWSLPGVGGKQDVEDVIPDSVVSNLEVQSEFSFLFPFPDDDNNHRLDGSNDDIYRHSSGSQDHFDIYKANGPAMNWVIEQMELLLQL